MKIPVKSLCYIILCIGFQMSSCSGPTDKQPETVEKQELPENTDSLEQPPKDGTEVESDSTEEQ